MKKLPALLLLFFLASCAHRLEVESIKRYQCGPQMITVKILNNDSAVVIVNELKVILNRVSGGNEPRYEDVAGQIVLTILKNNRVEFKLDKMVYPRCHLPHYLDSQPLAEEPSCSQS